MRKSGFVLLGFLVLIFFLFMWAFSDKIVERNLEKIGTKIVGAKVELSGVKFYPLKLKIQWQNLMVTNPDNTFENIVETGKSVFKLLPEPLLKGKFIVDSFKVTGLKFHTQRKVSGEIIEKKSKKKDKKISSKKTSNKEKKGLLSKTKERLNEKLNEERNSIPLFNFNKYSFVIDTNQLIQNFKPETGEHIERLIDNYSIKFENYSSEINEVEKGVDSLSIKARELQDRINTIDKKTDLKIIKKNIRDLQELISDSNKLEDEIKNIEKKFDRDYSTMWKDISRIDLWIENDYKRIMDNLRLPEVSGTTISKLLFGEKILNDLQKTVNTIKRVRAILFKVKRFMPSKKIPKRMKGQNIIFVKEKELPTVWIKDLFIGGKTKNGISLSGSILDLTSHQKLIERPTVLSISGEGLSGEIMSFSGVLNYIGKIPKERLKFTLDNFKINSVKNSTKEFALLNNSSFPVKINSGKSYLNANINFEDDDFNSSISIKSKDVKFIIDEKGKKLSKASVSLLKEIFSDINVVNVMANIRYINENMSIVITSNIDDVFNSKLNEIYSKKRDEVIKNVDEYMSKRKEEYKSKYSSFLKKNKVAIGDKISSYELKLKNLKRELLSEKDKINKKYESLENRLEKEAFEEYKKEKEKTKKKVESSIKKLF